jgi:hypothetical protein
MDQCINTLASDGAILTASPAVHLHKLEAEKNLGFSTTIKIKVSQNCAISKDSPFILLFNKFTVNFCLVI